MFTDLRYMYAQVEHASPCAIWKRKRGKERASSLILTDSPHLELNFAIVGYAC